MCFRVIQDVGVSGYLRSIKQWNNTNRKLSRTAENKSHDGNKILQNLIPIALDTKYIRWSFLTNPSQILRILESEPPEEVEDNGRRYILGYPGGHN
jgi:hypothetical protein